MFEAYLDAMRNYAVFTGRASRRDYWFFILTLALFAFASAILDSLFGTTTRNGGLFLGLVFVAHLMPQLAALARRLHDVGWSGWWLLILLTGVGGLFLLGLACLPGIEGPNPYGAAPIASPRPTANAVSSAPRGPGRLAASAAHKWLLIAVGLAILAGALAMVIDAKVGCGHPGVVANIEVSFRALPFTAELGGELKVQNITTVNEQGNVSWCQARISYPKRRASMPVEYLVTRSDDGKTFQVNITQFGQ